MKSLQIALITKSKTQITPQIQIIRVTNYSKLTL